ncbi:polycystin-1-like protein 3 [Ptychodera flava]|uniref:polycystin-1-like protein 3 n=1 Tax=Ptychodera flava TaxID=63121 RepID=UPI00396AB036
MMGDGNEFRLPPTASLFTDWPSQGTVNRIVKRLNRKLFQLGNKANTNDILSLSFTDRDGNELEVKDTKEDISITFARQRDSPRPETDLIIEGVYLEEDDVTYYGSRFNVSWLFHAVIIQLNSPDPLYGNTTMHILYDLGKNSSEYHANSFYLDVRFQGVHSIIFIPEHYFLMTGGYQLTFTAPQKHNIKFSMSVQHIMCNYLNEVSGIWNSDGCKVSPASNFTSTVCLCNHLTTFTAMFDKE